MHSSRIRIKMCGMTRSEDIAHAISLGVDAIGVIFYNKSKRYQTVAQASRLLHEMSAFVDVVAVFVNPDVSLVQQVISELPIQWLQFHGDETPKFCEQFGRPYIKAVPATSAAAIRQACEDYQQASAILLDTPSVNHGGSGEHFDWQMIPEQCAKPIILAGGLNALNVNTAIATCLPYAVDVCSGVEAMPGVKDYDKMNQFVKACIRK